MPSSRPPTVTLLAPGRLHLGFLDPSGSLGRRFGSVGMVIDGFGTAVELGAAAVDAVVADSPAAATEIDRAAACLDLLRQRTGRHAALQLRLRGVLPSHAGFGSGTQLALAIGRAFAAWHRLPVDTATLAGWLGRGLRSGIGIHGFDQGGLLVDGGPGEGGRPAPLLSRIALPAAWRVVVVQDRRERGLAGEAEKRAIAALAPLPREAAAEICHEVLMRILPGGAAGEIAPFARGVSRVQRLLGEHYAPVQHGRPFTSAAVGRLMDWMATDGAGVDAAIGQSSWGPTGFAIVASQADAETLVEGARAAERVERGLELRIVAVRNRGAEVMDTRVDDLAETRIATPVDTP